MKLVIICWILLATVPAVQAGTIWYYMRGNGAVPTDGKYSREVLDNTKSVMDAVRQRRIKKHLLTNSAETYDSGETLRRYQSFLRSDLMGDIMQISEEPYHG